MSETLAKVREELLSAVRELNRLGLVAGSSGNASVRLSEQEGTERYLITPSSVPYSSMTSDDLVVVDGDLEPVNDDGIPSIESFLHLAVYRAREDVGAVVHTHSLYASVAAVAGRPIPPVVDEMVVYIGGQVEVAEYGFPGTEDLASAAVAALGDRRAVLLRNHGVCAAGATLEEALRVAVLVERVAQIYVQAEMMGGARILPDEAIEAERSVYLMRSGLAE
ncbi:MAG: class II aldolase/adducin family protein [Dehalococcoidia bacterium]